MNANDFFANRANIKKGEYLSNQFGFTAGGPADHASKTFWFADYEGSLIKQARTWVTTVPTAAPARERLHQLSRTSSRCRAATVGADVPRAIVSARHGLRSGDDAAASRAGRSIR